METVQVIRVMPLHTGMIEIIHAKGPADA